MPGQEECKKCANCATISAKNIVFPPPCGHVICSSCFPNDPPQCVTTLDRSKCPVCQQVLLFPHQQPKSSFRALRLFGYVRDCLLEKNPPNCRSCADGQTKATAQCEKCLMYLCRDCANPHIRQGSLDDQHFVYTFKDIRLGASPKRSSRTEMVCCNEGFEIVKFCRSCEIGFCELCASEHQHSVVDLENGLKSGIEMYVAKVTACAQEADTVQTDLKAEDVQTNLDYETKKRKIVEHADLLIERIQKERDEALARLDEVYEIHEHLQKPLEQTFSMSEAQIAAMKASISLVDNIVKEEDITKTHLSNVFSFLKANSKAIDRITEAINDLHQNTTCLTPYDVIINHDVEVMINRVNIFSAVAQETLHPVLWADTHIETDSFDPHVVSMDVYSYNDGNCSVFIADEENCRVKAFNLRSDDDGMNLRLHKANIAAEKEPAVVFYDSTVRDERNQLSEAICVHYTDNSDPGSYHKLETMLQPFDKMKQLHTALAVKSVGPRYMIDGKWNKSPNILNLNEMVARECLQQGYFLIELVNTLRLELKFSRCIEGKIFAISAFHRASNRSILMIGYRERPLRILRFNHKTPGGVAIDSKCNIYYADPCNNRILVFTKLSEVIHDFVGSTCPVDLCILRDNGKPANADSAQSQEEHNTRKEYLMVVERKGGFKVFDLSLVKNVMLHGPCTHLGLET